MLSADGRLGKPCIQQAQYSVIMQMAFLMLVNAAPWPSQSYTHISVCLQIGSFIDMHQYVGPNAPLPTLTRAAVLGEFGGLGLRLEGHQLVPEDSFSYQEMHSPAELEVSVRDTHATPTRHI